MCRKIMFMHAWLDCDTTSAIHGHSKKSAIVKVCSKVAASHALSFYKDNQAPAIIEEAGKELFKDIYRAKGDASLTELRYRLYVQGVASSNTDMKPETLTPTESAAYFH